MCDAGGTLSLEQFKSFYKQVVNRPEVHVVLARYVSFLVLIMSIIIINYVCIDFFLLYKNPILVLSISKPIPEITSD